MTRKKPGGGTNSHHMQVCDAFVEELQEHTVPFGASCTYVDIHGHDYDGEVLVLLFYG